MLLSRWRALQLSTWEASGALAPASQQAPTHQPLLATLLRLLLPQGASQRCYGTSQSRETRIVPSQQGKKANRCLRLALSWTGSGRHP